MSSLDIDDDDKNSNFEPELPTVVETNRMFTSAAMSAYDAQLRWEEDVRHPKNCKGRIVLLFFYLYKVLLSLTPFWQCALIVITTAGSYYSVDVSGADEEKALFYSIMAGLVASAVLIFIHLGATRYFSFQLADGRRVVNIWQKATCIAYTLLVLMLIFCSLALARIADKCADVKGKCDIQDVLTNWY